MIEASINGSFGIFQFKGKYLFIKREDNGLWELSGGGFNINEVDYRAVLIREAFEEMKLKVSEKKMKLCAILGQTLKAEVSAQIGGVLYGLAFLHSCISYDDLPPITLSHEHTEYRLFTLEEIMDEWESFSSGPLWMFFTYLAFQETGKVQEGMLTDRKIWRGKEYTLKIAS